MGVTDNDPDYTHYVYIVECSDGTYYTGYSTDVDRRVKQHNNGNGAKYTASRRPVELVYVEKYIDQSDAMSREYEIKQFSRRKKERLVDGDVNPPACAAERVVTP